MGMGMGMEMEMEMRTEMRTELGGGEEAPPPDIASGGYERRAAFELWELEAATLVAGPERPSAKCTPFAPDRHGVILK